MKVYTEENTSGQLSIQDDFIVIEFNNTITKFNIDTIDKIQIKDITKVDNTASYVLMSFAGSLTAGSWVQINELNVLFMMGVSVSMFILGFAILMLEAPKPYDKKIYIHTSGGESEVLYIKNNEFKKFDL